MSTPACFSRNKVKGKDLNTREYLGIYVPASQPLPLVIHQEEKKNAFKFIEFPLHPIQTHLISPFGFVVCNWGN